MHSPSIRIFYLLTVIVLVVLARCVNANDEAARFTPDQIEFFESKIRPVLVEHCYDCHSTDAQDLEAGLYVAAL